MSVIIRPSGGRWAGVDYTGNSTQTLGSTLETAMVNGGFAKWAPGSAPAVITPVALQVTDAGGATPVNPANGQVVGVSAPQMAVMDLLRMYEVSRYSNPRISTAIPSANIAFGGAPAAGTIGYANSGVAQTGYNMSGRIDTGITNVAPAQNGTTVNKPFRVYGGMAYSNNGIQAMGYYTLAGARNQTPSARLVFITDEPKPIIRCGGYGVNYMMNVNDGTGWRSVVDPAIAAGVAYVTNAAFTGNAAGGIQPVQLDFSQVGGRKTRMIEIVLYQDTTIEQIGITPASSYFDPPISNQVLVFTDSLGASVTAGNQKDAWPCWVQDLTGWRDLWDFTEGGTGFVANNGGIGRTHIQKIQNAAQFPQLSRVALVILPASVNDNGSPAATVTAAVTAACQAARAAWPNALIVVPGPTAQASLANQAQGVSQDAAVAAGVAAVGSSQVVYFPTMADPYGQAITGSGNVQAPAGNGNADVYFNNTDNTHPNPAGHQYWGQSRIVPGVVNQLLAFAVAAA